MSIKIKELILFLLILIVKKGNDFVVKIFLFL